MFQARLQVAFRGVPWEEKVREEQYRVLTHDLRIVDQQNWTDLVSPRSKLRMSIVIREVAFPDKICLAGDTLCKAVRTECLMMTAYVLSPYYSVYTPRSLPTVFPDVEKKVSLPTSTFRCLSIIARRLR